jgi:hypothetical protein
MYTPPGTRVLLIRVHFGHLAYDKGTITVTITITITMKNDKEYPYQHIQGWAPMHEYIEEEDRWVVGGGGEAGQR